MTANLDDSDELTVSNGRTANVIMARLRRAIESGVYADGDQLPAERQLAITFGTARSTIRKVLDRHPEITWAILDSHDLFGM